MGEYHYLFKIIMLGDPGVGKSSLLTSFADGCFVQTTQTIGVDFKSRVIAIDGFKINVQVWDTAGSEKFASMMRSYYRGSAAAIVAFALNSRRTFESLDQWLREVEQGFTKSTVLALVGCKCDDSAHRAVSKEEGIAFALKHNLLYFESSASDSINVYPIFSDICKEVLTRVRSGSMNITGADGIKLGTLAAAAKPVEEPGCC